MTDALLGGTTRARDDGWGPAYAHYSHDQVRTLLVTVPHRPRTDQ
ncbi:hypothetical protein [Kitasatospora sp. SolWspMP-SS2h]|nr:hypothetical protein [Kitasatospora sp. SolWspMP-SS2h]